MEVLLTCDEADLSKLSVNIWNPTTGTKLLSLRGPPAHAQSLALIRDEGVLIAETGKPFIHFWQTGQSLQSSRRILCPGKPGPVAMTPDGSFLAVAIEEKIYIWQVATGRMVSVVNSAHYRPVTVLKFTDDGTHLASGGQDGMVLVWKLLSLVSGESTLPKYSWTDHSFSITGIHIGLGGSQATVFTVSSDRTAKIYSLATGTLLLSISFHLPLTTVVTDTAETAFYVGSTTGTIYEMKIHSAPRSIEHHVTSDSMADSVLRKHKDTITALSMSADGKTLASGDSAGLVFLWDTETKQAIKTLAGIKSKVTNLLFWLGNPDSWKGGRKPQVIFPEVPKLVEQSDERNQLDQVVMVWNRSERSIVQSGSTSTDGETNGGSMSIQMAKLRAELDRAERINSRLHEFCVEQILKQSPPAPTTTDINSPAEAKKSARKTKRKSTTDDEPPSKKKKKKVSTVVSGLKLKKKKTILKEGKKNKVRKEGRKRRD